MLGIAGIWPESRSERALTGATLVSSFGFAAFATASGLFFVRFVELSPHVVGLGLAIAGFAGLASPLLFGRIADAVETRTLTLWLFALQAVFVAGYALTRSTAGFVLVATAVTVVDRGTWVARSVLITRVVGPEHRVRFKAQQRTVFNIGAALGALSAAVPLQLNTRAWYLGLLAAYVLTCALAAICVAVIPPEGERQRSGPRGWTALRDRPYVAAALTSGLLMLHHSLLIIALPLWVARSTEAPTFLVAVLVALNTVLAVLLQVRLSAGAETIAGAARVGRKGALVLVPACALLGLAGHGNAVGATLALVAGVVLLTLGELWTSTASWGLSYALAPEEVMGEYQGVFSLGLSIEAIVGPLIATSVVVAWGLPGWLVVGLCFLVLALIIVPVASWGERTRPGAIPTGEPRASLASPSATSLASPSTTSVTHSEEGP